MSLIYFLSFYFSFLLLLCLEIDIVLAEGTSTDMSGIEDSENNEEESEDENTPKQDKGKGKAKDEYDKEDDSGFLLYLEKLLAERDELIFEYEDANREWNKSGLEVDKLKSDLLASRLDEIEDQIEELKAHGFVDPMDSENEDEN